jgi:predicted Rossmann fold nucleotide-binding protein DprA/Smf involved in DNA uptake
MAPRSQSALAAFLLAQRLVDARTSPLKATEYWALLASVPDPGELLGLDVDGIARAASIDKAMAERIAGLFDAATACAFALDEFEQSGLRVVTSVDDEYPLALADRLGTAAPPALYCAGDRQLLAGELLGIVGSRNIDEAGAEVARAAARVAAEHGLGVVSGGAKGVDRLAMNAAFEAGAPVVGVLADSLVRMTRDPEVRTAITEGQACFCSAFKPTSGFSAANAMGRNKIIYALSRATLVVATDVETGGTWAGATEALRRGFAPVAVWTGEGAVDGNARLVDLGARPVTAVDELFAQAQPPGSETVDRGPDAEQLALGV